MDPSRPAHPASGQRRFNPTTETDFDYVELIDPTSGAGFFANIKTGECVWTEPKTGRVRRHDPQEETWWELLDERRKIPYYFNTRTGVTEWTRPKDERYIIPLFAVQKNTVGKRISLAMSARPDSPKPSERTASPGTARREVPAAERTPQTGAANSIDRASPIAVPSGSPRVYSPGVPRQTPGRNGSEVRPTPSDSQSPTVESSHRTPALATQRPSSALRDLSDGTAKPPTTVTRNEARSRSSSVGDSGTAPTKPANSFQLPAKPSPQAQAEVSEVLKSYRSLPQDLAREITQFRMEGFAKRYFAERRKGFLRRRVPPESILQWSKEPLKAPLLVLARNVQKDALGAFKSVQRIMGDRPAGGSSAMEDMQSLLELGVDKGVLRDEMLVQVCKQLTKNPSRESTYRGWELLGVLLIGFPPSKNLELYLESFINAGTRSNDDKIMSLSQNCSKKLSRIGKAGPRGKVPAPQEIERARVAAYSPSVFGESLEEVMRIQSKQFPNDSLPHVMTFLADAVLSLGGCKTEGIFRVPGDSDSVADLKCRVENGKYDIRGILDPSIPASLLKLWMRELEDPIIPKEFYSRCIEVGKWEGENRDGLTEAAWGVVARLSPLSRSVANYMVRFLRVVADPDNQRVTKMGLANLAMVWAPNFLRCPSDDPAIIFENTKYEQSFLKLLIVSGECNK